MTRPAMRLTLRQLNVFREIYRTHQISRAAKRLSMSISAVSLSLKELESGLRAHLFERRSAGLEPTDAAEQLFPYANLILEKTLEAEQLFAARTAGQAGALRIGSNKMYGIYVLSRLLPRFKQTHPAILTSLRIDGNDLIEAQVLDHSLDVGFISGPPHSGDLESFPCFDDRPAIVCSPASHLYYPGVTKAELSAATWILDDEKPVRDSVLQWLAARGISAHGSIVMSMMGSIKRAVGTGLGVAVLPHLAVQEELARMDLVELLAPDADSHQVDINRAIHAVWRSDQSGVLRSLFFEGCGIHPIQARD